MLRVYFLQQWDGLADEALDDALYDSQAMRDFARIDLDAAGVPDTTTLLKFRGCARRTICARASSAPSTPTWPRRGLLLRAGTLVDATLIAAPSSTKNRAKQCDPKMHQTKKGNQWHFGLKAHIVSLSR